MDQTLTGAEGVVATDGEVLRALVRSNVAGVVLADGERILEANDRFLETVGRTRAEVRAGAVSWVEMTPPEWAEADVRALELLRTQGFVEPFEKEYVRPDGRRVPVSVGAATLQRDPLMVVAFVLDESERQAVEEDRRRSLEAETAVRRRLDGVLSSIGEAFFAIDRAGRFTFVNARAERLLDRPAASLVGRPVAEALPELVGSDLHRAVARANERREPVALETRVRLTGRERWCEVRGYPTEDGIAVLVADIDDRKRLELERAAALERLGRLAHAAGLLAAAPDADAVARTVLEQALAATGASCGVLAVAGDRALAVRHRVGLDAGRAPGEIPLDADLPMPEALRRRRAVVLTSRAEWLARYPIPPRGDFEAFAAVPLVSEGVVHGVAGLGFPASGDLAGVDAELLSVLAAQGAQALARAVRHERERHVARTLQQGLLPRGLPEVPGLDVVTRYAPMGGGDEVGGDFLDLVASPGGWTAVVGDVCGKGVEAGVVTGLARHTFRATARLLDDPRDVLRELNAALLAEGDDRFVTAVLARIVPDGDGFAVRCAGGGHPWPVLRRADGTVEEVRATGALLGVAETIAAEPADLRLGPGDALVLYTDGVTDAREDGAPLGVGGLLGAVASAPSGAAAALADAIEAAVAAVAAGPSRDDRALVVLGVPAAGASPNASAISA